MNTLFLALNNELTQLSDYNNKLDPDEDTEVLSHAEGQVDGFKQAIKIVSAFLDRNKQSGSVPMKYDKLEICRTITGKLTRIIRSNGMGESSNINVENATALDIDIVTEILKHVELGLPVKSSTDYVFGDKLNYHHVDGDTFEVVFLRYAPSGKPVVCGSDGNDIVVDHDELSRKKEI